MLVGLESLLTHETLIDLPDKWIVGSRDLERGAPGLCAREFDVRGQQPRNQLGLLDGLTDELSGEHDLVCLILASAMPRDLAYRTFSTSCLSRNGSP